MLKSPGGNYGMGGANLIVEKHGRISFRPSLLVL